MSLPPSTWMGAVMAVQPEGTNSSVSCNTYPLELKLDDQQTCTSSPEALIHSLGSATSPKEVPTLMSSTVSAPTPEFCRKAYVKTSNVNPLSVAVAPGSSSPNGST